MTTVNQDTIVTTARFVASTAGSTLPLLNFTQEKWELLSGGQPWTHETKDSAETYLRAIISGTLSMAGLPKIQIPAEVVATLINMFVHPVNWWCASNFFEKVQTALDMAQENDHERVTAKEVFAMCQLINTTAHKKEIDKKLKIKLMELTS